ncbi:dTDP-4-dehydrorhamnose 3,5-epimerase [Spirosoma sp. SC4-14]|uniref:dTDP-4-dehydrorhamnose 3,5-epimerase n=1 Tax=Spirosoma sp. SC4-14 TaxID=3128900 RepID=UPI0030D2C3DE
MTFTETPLLGAYLIQLAPFRDHRGWFARTFCKRDFEQVGLQGDWVQHNHSMTHQAGALRGLHFQYTPYSEVKLVRCIAGCVFDVIVDLRADSTTFGNWFGTELSHENGQMLYIPKGFAHGFQTLTENCQLIYCHSEYYFPGNEGGIRYNDPRIGISWPLPITDLSERDATHPLLNGQFVGLTV